MGLPEGFSDSQKQGEAYPYADVVWVVSSNLLFEQSITITIIYKIIFVP